MTLIKDMKVIGVTGGVGCGKSALLNYIQEHYNCRILYADLVAKMLQEAEGECRTELVKLLGKEVVGDRQKMAEFIFSDKSLLEKVNEIVHPATTAYIVSEIEKERKKGKVPLFFVEAALLIENGFDAICDEMWYIYAREDVRRKRLFTGRGYSDEKCMSIMEKQLSEEEFRKHCDKAIDNSESMEKSVKQIDSLLEDYQWHEQKNT